MKKAHHKFMAHVYLRLYRSSISRLEAEYRLFSIQRHIKCYLNRKLIEDNICNPKAILSFKMINGEAIIDHVRYI